MQEEIKSPCIKKCNLFEGYCTGCYRTLDQIVKWARSSDEDKLKILKNIKWRKETLSEK